MNKQPFFSIIIPTLNEEIALPLLLKDLKKQTFLDFETIVSDANSTDKTEKIAKQFKVKLIKNKKANVAWQRNLGANKAQGKYLLFIDADTRLPYYFLEGIKYRLTKNPADVFTTWIDQNQLTGTNKAIITFLNLIIESSKLIDLPAAIGSMIGCKRTIFRQIKGFDPEIAFGEDIEFVQRLTKQNYHFAVFKDPTFIFSFRRFKKEGHLPLLQKYAKLNLQWLLSGFPKTASKDYPMLGGTYYKTKKTYPKLLSSLDKILSKVKKIKRKKIFKKFIKDFLD